MSCLACGGLEEESVRCVSWIVGKVDFSPGPFFHIHVVLFTFCAPDPRHHTIVFRIVGLVSQYDNFAMRKNEVDILTISAEKQVGKLGGICAGRF